MYRPISPPYMYLKQLFYFIYDSIGMPDNSLPLLPTRKRPAREGLVTRKYTDYIFVTCCTRAKIRGLDNERAYSALVTLWNDSSHWSVTRFVIMPDHVHLMIFASRYCAINLRKWAGWWKARTTKALGYSSGTLWLPDLWDTRMRSVDHLSAKLSYMRENPVRAGLVSHAELWPFQGDLVSVARR